MRVMVIVKATKDSEAGVLPSTELLTEMGRFNEELVKAGVLLSAEGLRASSHGVRVRFGGGKSTVIDGPFTETKELIAGFWLWQVKSIEEAFEADDFGENLTPELRAQQLERRARLAAKT